MLRKFIILFGHVNLILLVNSSSLYDNHTLLSLYPGTQKQVEATLNLQDPDNALVILKVTHGVNDTTDVLVPPEKYDFVTQFAEQNDLHYEIKAKNYGRTFEDSLDRTPKRRVLREFDLFNYHSYNEMLQFLDSVQKRYPNLVTVKALGSSFEGRKMYLIKISANPQAKNPIILVDAGIHAREWAAPAMAMYLIHRLTSDPTAKDNELNGVDWYIIPQANPDGYEYSRSSPNNRLWRKTRSKNSGSNCLGVDGNRNYGFKWAISGVSTDPCHKETYAGPKPFSEIETRMIRRVMMENASRIKLYISVHAYGNYLVYPWGYTGDFLPKQWRKLDAMARSVSNAVQKAGGSPFKVLSAGKWYPAAGGSDDFAFGAVGIPYSYTMELTDGYEFNFPQNLLRQVLPQFYEGFKVFGEQIRREFSSSQG